MDKDSILRMSYTEFIAYVDQWNVPPGALDTINQWSVFGHVNESSKILEIACTTGLSSREISRITECKAKGIDICPYSVNAASFNAKRYADKLELDYECVDASKYQSDSKYTHVIIGAGLGFFEQPKQMLDKIPDFFDDYGYILASPYYSNGEMPDDIKNECKKIIGITPTTMSYDSVRDMYENYEIAYEKRCNIIIETEEQMKKYAYDTVKRGCEIRGIKSEEIFECMYKRLYDIKRISNEMHKYQSYSVMVLRYLKDVYPNKFLELF